MVFSILFFWLYVRYNCLVNEAFVFPQCSPIPAQQFLGLIILLFSLLAPLACEPDVYKNALTGNYSV